MHWPLAAAHGQTPPVIQIAIPKAHVLLQALGPAAPASAPARGLMRAQPIQASATHRPPDGRAPTGAVSFGNVQGADQVYADTATWVNPTFSSSNKLKAGSYAQNVTGTLTGTDADNYSFTGMTTAGANYTVSKLALTGAAIANTSTIYGTPAATGAVSFNNVIGSDVVTPATATLVAPSYSSSNNLKAGSYAQSVTGALTGTDADNYSFSGMTTTGDNYTVSKLALTGAAIANTSTIY
eukprot:gene42995-53351_t